LRDNWLSSIVSDDTSASTYEKNCVSTEENSEEIDFDDEKIDEKNEKKNDTNKKKKNANNEKTEKNGKKGEKGYKKISKVSPRDVISPPRIRVFLSVEKAMMVCSEVLAITLGGFIYFHCILLHLILSSTAIFMSFLFLR
jgi:hypothetical protein